MNNYRKIEEIVENAFVEVLDREQIPRQYSIEVCTVLMRMAATMAVNLQLEEDEFLNCCKMLFEDENTSNEPLKLCSSSN